MVVRGVPDKLAKDGWWLDDPQTPSGFRALPLLVVVLAAADILFWEAGPGLGFVVWICVTAFCIILTTWKTLDGKRSITLAGILALTIAPLVEVVQFPTIVMAFVGLVIFGVVAAGPPIFGWRIVKAVMRFPREAILQTGRDLFATRVALPEKGSWRGVFYDWALPAGVGGIFICLLLAANPVLDGWAVAVFDIDLLGNVAMDRVVFWVLLALVVWPFLRLTAMQSSLTNMPVGRSRTWRSGFINVRSVQRALVVFNLIFLTQTLLDLRYLWGGFSLPEGMSYANYAHRGAYPLLVTALLAGGFALLAQPYLAMRRILRVLLFIWVGQTMLLVLSSILRLDLYVDAFGLTRLRFAAFVWMGVVAGGLGLIVMQIITRQSLAWFFARAGGLGLIAFYVCCLINIDGLIARNNLAQGYDDYYLCTLGDGAQPAIRSYELRTGQPVCGRSGHYLRTPDDWREWGYRNARLRRSLAVLEENQ